VIKAVPKSSQPKTPVEPIVYVIDDDAGIRAALGRLFRSVGLRAELFTSANEFLQSKPPRVPSCLVLDVRLPGLSGFELHAELSKANVHIPIIFITAHGDIPMSVRAMKGGAIDFLTKPFRDQDLLDAVTAAIAADRARRDAESVRLDLQNLFGGLTPREQEVMALVTKGLMNKQVAAEMGLSEITVKIHRGHMMKKMKATSLADLVKMAEAIGINRATSP
jgi:FixJ family two-component response regulator